MKEMYASKMGDKNLILLILSPVITILSSNPNMPDTSMMTKVMGKVLINFGKTSIIYPISIGPPPDEE